MQLELYDGPCAIVADGTLIEGKRVDKCSAEGLLVYAKRLIITNSLVSAAIYENSDTASVTVMDTEVAGGSGYYGAVGGWDRPNDTPGTDGYLNMWSNNAFDDGTPINP